jgi:D-alanine-D-alanine ligase
MKIVVLAGGISTERDVSLCSGSMIYKALKKNGHQVMMLDVFLGYPEEDWENVFDKDEDWTKIVAPITDNNPDIEKVKALRPDWKKNYFGPHVIQICQNADVVFMALHGENGENGKIQACFDLMGIRYTGTDYVSSALTMDKGLSKELFLQYGVPTAKSVRVEKGDEIPQFPLPCVVKACRGGSSVGVALAFNEKEYQDALKEAFRYDTEVIIEQYVKGREFSVAVINGRALPVIEIAPKQGFYDYKNKYQAGSTVETCPADLPKEKSEEMRRYAELAFKALRLQKYARMDFMMNDKGEMFCLEGNTLPGMTPTSLMPQEAAAEGTSFEELCEMIIQSAF